MCYRSRAQHVWSSLLGLVLLGLSHLRRNDETSWTSELVRGRELRSERASEATFRSKRRFDNSWSELYTRVFGIFIVLCESSWSLKEVTEVGASSVRRSTSPKRAIHGRDRLQRFATLRNRWKAPRMRCPLLPGVLRHLRVAVLASTKLRASFLDFGFFGFRQGRSSLVVDTLES